MSVLKKERVLVETTPTGVVIGVKGSNLITYSNDDTQTYNLKDKQKEALTPSKIILQDDDKLLAFTSDKLDIVNIETGQILRQGRACYNDDVLPFKSVVPDKKFSNLTPSKMINLVGSTTDSVFKFDWDTREKDTNIKLEDSNITKIEAHYTSIATTGNGEIAIGDKKGVVRLISSPAKSGLNRAKTNLNQLSDPVRNVCTSKDGEWVLWTTKEYVVLVNVLFERKGQQLSGFYYRMGNDRPDSLLLNLTKEEMETYRITNLDFRDAKFDNGPHLNDDNVIENEIIVYTENLVVQWNFRKVKKWYKNRMSERVKPLIYAQRGNVIDNAFHYNNNKDVVIAMEDRISTLSLD